MATFTCTIRVSSPSTSPVQTFNENLPSSDQVSQSLDEDHEIDLILPYTSTVDQVKCEAFKRAKSFLPQDSNRSQYELGISENGERFSVEFQRFLACHASFQRMADDDVVIRLRLLEKLQQNMAKPKISHRKTNSVAPPVLPKERSRTVTGRSDDQLAKSSLVLPSAPMGLKPGSPSSSISKLSVTQPSQGKKKKGFVSSFFKKTPVQSRKKDSDSPNSSPEKSASAIYAPSVVVNGEPQKKIENAIKAWGGEAETPEPKKKKRSASMIGSSSIKQGGSPVMGRVLSKGIIAAPCKAPPPVPEKIKKIEDALKAWGEDTPVAGAEEEEEEPIEDLSEYFAETTTLECDLINKEIFGYHFELGSTAVTQVSRLRLEADKQENLYLEYFYEKPHTNYIGLADGTVGPVALSFIQETKDSGSMLLLRAATGTTLITSPEKPKSSFKSLLSLSSISINQKSLTTIKPKVHEPFCKELLSYDKSLLIGVYKFGVLLAREGQTTEEEWFNNEHSTPGFERFLPIIGEIVPLMGWDKFRGGLDVKRGSTGEESVYTVYQENEIMFHVSTMLPYTPGDEQQLERKRHLGNDIVVIIFKEGNTPFDPTVVRSEFNHIWFIIEEVQGDEYDLGRKYRLAIVAKDGVQAFGPKLPHPAEFTREELRAFIHCKLINAEWSAYRSPEFAHKIKRTRKMQLDYILQAYK